MQNPLMEQVEDYIAHLFDQQCHVTTIRMPCSFFERFTNHLTSFGLAAYFKRIGRNSYEWPTACGIVSIEVMPDNA